MYLCFYMYIIVCGLLLLQQVEGIKKVSESSEEHDEDILSKSNTEIVMTINNTVEEIAEMDDSMEVSTLLNYDEDFKDISSKNNTEISGISDGEVAKIDGLIEMNTLFDEYDILLPELSEFNILDEVEDIEHVERTSRALGEHFQPTYYPNYYWPVFANEYKQFVWTDHFKPLIVPSPYKQPYIVPIKQTIPAKGKVQIVGSFTDFYWNLPTSAAANNEGVLDNNDNFGIVNQNYDAILPTSPFYDNGLSFSNENIFNNVNLQKGRPYDNRHFPDAMLHDDEGVSEQIVLKKIPVKGKVTITAKFGNCGFM